MHRRTSSYLDDGAMKALKLLAAVSGTTVSEKIREAVDTMLATQVGLVNWPAEMRRCSSVLATANPRARASR